MREYIEAVNREINYNEDKKATFSDSISLGILSDLKGSIRRYLESGKRMEETRSRTLSLREWYSL